MNVFVRIVGKPNQRKGSVLVIRKCKEPTGECPSCDAEGSCNTRTRCKDKKRIFINQLPGRRYTLPKKGVVT